MGRFVKDDIMYVLVSGYAMCPDGKGFDEETILFQIAKDGTVSAFKEWNFELTHANSIAFDGRHVYLGRNKMITSLDVVSGECRYFTNKTEEEMAALKMP